MTGNDCLGFVIICSCMRCSSNYLNWLTLGLWTYLTISPYAFCWFLSILSSSFYFFFNSESSGCKSFFLTGSYVKGSGFLCNSNKCSLLILGILLLVSGVLSFSIPSYFSLSAIYIRHSLFFYILYSSICYRLISYSDSCFFKPSKLTL